MATAATGVVGLGQCCSISGASRRSQRFGDKISSHWSSHGGRVCEALRSSRKRVTRSGARSVAVRAAKLPAGIEAPKEEPKLPVSFWGFTENAEVWNARASMIGLFGIIALEFFAHKGLLELFGFEVGKGLDLPL